MYQRRFTKNHEQVLKDQVIDLDRPGTILHDSQVVLDYLGVDGAKAAGKHNLLPMSAIAELDGRLARPLRLQMQRPQLRSHPYLQGLHLLLRASGLSRAHGTGSQARLVLNPEILAQWNQFNPTEKYFTLLTSWFHFASGEMVGEHHRPILLSCLEAWHYLPARGVRFDLTRPNEVRLFGIWREFYLLALMHLFGLVSVDLPETHVQPWRPAGVRHVPFGDAMFTLLANHFASDMSIHDEEVRGDLTEGFAQWQDLFQPYFPEWRHIMKVPEPEKRPGRFTFRVSLGNVWRRIAMPADATLDDLVYEILESFDFDHDHLYEFTYRNRFGATTRVGDPEAGEGLRAHELRLEELPLDVGGTLQLLYDFGDNWKFQVLLEAVDPQAKKSKPRVLECHGKAPPQYQYAD